MHVAFQSREGLTEGPKAIDPLTCRTASSGALAFYFDQQKVISRPVRILTRYQPADSQALCI